MKKTSYNLLHGFRNLLILFFLSLTISNAQTSFYISNSGNDSNDGKSPSTAWQSLSKVWSSWWQVQPGDSILFKRGDVWAPTTSQAPGAMLRIPNRLSGMENNFIVIGAYGSGSKPIISSENHPSPNYVQALRSGSMKFIEVRDIEFRGLIEFYTQDDLQIGVQDFRFLNNTLDGSYCGGKIAFRSDYYWENSQVPDSNHAAPLTRVELGYNTIKNTTNGDACNFLAPGDFLYIHHNSWYNVAEEALDIAGGFGHIVEYNFISGAKIQGMKITSQFNPLKNLTLRGNIIVRGDNGGYTSGNAIVLQNIMDCKIYNNTFIGGVGGYSAYIGDRDRDGVHAHYGTFEGNIIENNIFYGIVGVFGKYNDVVNKIWDRNTFNNNIYWSNQYLDYVFRIDQSPIIYIHNSDQNKFIANWQSKSSSTEKMVDPLFENPIWIDTWNYGNYSLLDESPAINSAKIISEYEYDFNGVLVPQNGLPDIGALEKISADTESPILENLNIESTTSLILTFSETLESTSAENGANYIIDNGVIVQGASISIEGNTVFLTVSELTPGTTYNLTVVNIQDLSGNVIDPNNSTPILIEPVITSNNLVANCNFECGAFTNWAEGNTIGGAVYTSEINSDTPISGSYDATISVIQAGSYNARPMMVAFLSEPTEVGNIYTLSFKTRVISGNPTIEYVYLGDQVIHSDINLSGDQTWTFQSSPVSVSRDFICFYVDGTTISSFSIDDISYTTNEQPVLANVKVLLQGPFSNGMMTTYLKDADLIPLEQPYNTAPWNYAGTESLSSVPDNIVDWVLLELRTDISVSTKVETKAALLRNDGQIVALDGLSLPEFETAEDGNYYIVVKHRNHLAVMSNEPAALGSDPQLFDFSLPSKAYGFNPQIDLGDGKFGLKSGDANGSGDITASDNVLCWRPENGTIGYKCSDFNLTGDVTASDNVLNWRVNNGNLSQVPSN